MTDSPPTGPIPEALADRLRGAGHVVALTGAGLSADSGLATFRDIQTGLWSRYRPEELATPAAFARQPDVVWNWYQWRREGVLAARPNAGHEALVRLEQRIPRFTLITQNVDGLHERAGSRAVIELHGRITRTRCSRDGAIVTKWKEGGSIPPRCPDCDAFLRPDVVWFGEALPEDALRHAAAAAAACDVFLSIGTSGVVYPAASLLPIARSGGAAIAIINTEDFGTSSDPGTFPLTGSASILLPALVDSF